MIITISGYPGAGKTIVRELLSEQLCYKSFYAGDIFRAMQNKQNGERIEKLYKELEQFPMIERAVDERQERLMRMHDNYILEGRLAAFLAPDVPKVRILLTVWAYEGARRQHQRKENCNKSITELIKVTRERIALERERYQKLYRIPDHLNQKCFDITIDTTKPSPQEITIVILEKLKTIKPRVHV